jgi:alanyl-tRNA synthetase
VHVTRTGDIGLFKIVSEGGVAAGIRRIEAVTGEGALAWVQATNRRLQEAASALKTGPDELPSRIAQVQDQVKALEKEVNALKSKLAAGQGDELAGQAVEVNGVKVLAATMEGADVNALRETMDKLKDKLGTAAIVLASVLEGKVSLIAGVTKDATGKVKAGDLVNFVAQQVGGKGGGRPDMAVPTRRVCRRRWPAWRTGSANAGNSLHVMNGRACPGRCHFCQRVDVVLTQHA